MLAGERCLALKTTAGTTLRPELARVTELASRPATVVGTPLPNRAGSPETVTVVLGSSRCSAISSFHLRSISGSSSCRRAHARPLLSLASRLLRAMLETVNDHPHPLAIRIAPSPVFGCANVDRGVAGVDRDFDLPYGTGTSTRTSWCTPDPN